MNTVNQHDLDRMVDGELSEGGRRQLLQWCERHGKWRDLALAYVEGQTWRQEIKAFREPEHSFTAPTEAIATRPAKDRTGWQALSLAASMLVALSIGLAAGWLWQDKPSRQVVTLEPSVAPNVPEVASASDATSDAVSPYSSMRIAVPDAEHHGFRQIDLPTITASTLGNDWQNRISPMLPEDLIRQLRREGLRLQENRTLVPVRLSDGRIVVVPIDYYFEQELP